MTFYNGNNSRSSVPNSELFNRIRHSQASITEAQAYLQQLHQFVNHPESFRDPKINIAIDHISMVELILENLGLPTSEPETRASEFNVVESSPTSSADRLEKTYSRQKTVQELEAEILAAATSKNPQLALTKVAAANGTSFHAVENLAKELLKGQGLDTQYDLAKADYTRCMHEIREIELNEDPGEKDWKLQDLARRHHRNKKEMMEVYFKSLLMQHLEDPISLKDYTQAHPEGRKWLLRGWIPSPSLTLIHGHGGDGKTLFTHHLLKHVAQGIDWGEYKVKTGNNGILYIQTDTAIQSAVEALKQAGISNDVPIQLHGKWRIEFMSYLYKWIKQQQPALVVIDSLTSVNRYSTVDENHTEYARPILQMQDIASEFGCSFILIHHSNSSGGARGTKAVRAAVDQVWRIERVNQRDESDPKRLLAIEKSRSRATGRYVMSFEEEDFSWNLLEPEDENGEPTQNSSARWLIVNHLNRHPDVRFCAEDLAHHLNIKEATVRRELPGLSREGLIDRELNPRHNYNVKGQPKHYYLIRL